MLEEKLSQIQPSQWAYSTFVAYGTLTGLLIGILVTRTRPEFKTAGLILGTTLIGAATGMWCANTTMKTVTKNK